MVVLAGSLPGWKAGMQIQIPFGVSQPPQVPASRSVPGRANGPGQGESLLACSDSLATGLGLVSGGTRVYLCSVCLSQTLDNLEKVFKQIWMLVFFVE